MEDLKSLEDLLELMDVDLQIDKLLDQRSSLPELDDYKTAHAEVERIDSALDTARTSLQEADRGMSKTNGELEIAAEKAAAEQNRLYAGGLSAKDADYLRREVEMLYAKVSKMEDQVLEFIEAKEIAEENVERLTGELSDATEDKDALAASITEQWRLIDKELALKEQRKGATISLVDEYLLEIYDHLRDTGKGRVVGRLADDTCGACHLKLSAAEVGRALKQDPPRCIHCRAILVG
ncbi:MAG: hypothetical protein ABFR95_11520 [Actinomycetota bacterium]